jgi:hypothetical protein
LAMRTMVAVAVFVKDWTAVVQEMKFFGVF